MTQEMGRKHDEEEEGFQEYVESKYVQPFNRHFLHSLEAEIAKHILFKQRKLILRSDLYKHYCFTKGP